MKGRDKAGDAFKQKQYREGSSFTNSKSLQKNTKALGQILAKSQTKGVNEIKEAVRGVLSHIIVHSGVSALHRRFFRQNGALIFYGHRIAADDEGYLQGLCPEWLDAQLTYLTRHYEIISLSRLLQCFEQQQQVPHKSAVITFDDGFRDNMTRALPILQRHHVPATIFLVTGSVTHRQLPWPQQLGFMLQHTAQSRLQLKGVGYCRELPLKTSANRRHAYLTLQQHTGSLPRLARKEFLSKLAVKTGVDAPLDRMLSWHDAQEMQASGVEFGAHTYSHPWLSEMPFAEAKEEMERSRVDLINHLGVHRPSFCFPAGRYTPALMDIVPKLGFRSVFQRKPQHRVNSLMTTSAFSLGRIGLPNAPVVQLVAEIDGPLPVLRKLLRYHRTLRKM